MSREKARKFYHSKKWLGTREYILRRDKYMCQECGSPINLQVHHIEYLTEDNVDDPNISMNEKNLTTLCRDCHFKAHEYKRVEHMKGSDVVEGYCFDECGNVQRG